MRTLFQTVALSLIAGVLSAVALATTASAADQCPTPTGAPCDPCASVTGAPIPCAPEPQQCSDPTGKPIPCQPPCVTPTGVPCVNACNPAAGQQCGQQQTARAARRLHRWWRAQ